MTQYQGSKGHSATSNDCAESLFVGNPNKKTTRESDVSILKRLHLLDISCGTWEAVRKCDKSDNGLETRWYHEPNSIVLHVM